MDYDWEFYLYPNTKCPLPSLLSLPSKMGIDGATLVRIARIFNTYGPRMCLDDGRVVSNFVAQAIRKQPLTVYGDGKQTRSFQYVSDLVCHLDMELNLLAVTVSCGTLPDALAAMRYFMFASFYFWTL
ncbi:unnamed protein product [Ilex paraguariensis]|uniref:NAD-dependent epimerase/dehydratase domain-containing protein n=1 Tax=Ilex paraguariensis TaxID=185542 RepID=A0ABC8RW59_9AQUA